MEIIQPIVLGFVQGVGEFLPISSSAHLILVPWLFNWADQGLAYDLALHLGTLLAVITYFRKDLWHMCHGFYYSLFKSTRDFEENVYQKLSWFVIVATIPATVFGFFLEGIVESTFRNPIIVATALVLFGIVLYIAEVLGKKTKDLNTFTLKDSIVVGFMQVLALVPGVSRSGSTMVGGLLRGLKREDAARFSFLLAIPITAGAILTKISEFQMNLNFGLGFASSFIFGFLAIKYLLRYISNHDFKIFVWYRLVLAAVIVGVYLIR